MDNPLHFDISRQPTDSTCGPTCLHAIYDYFGDRRPLDQVAAEIPYLQNGGTLGVFLANHALRQGYRATIYSYNLLVFDPTWFDLAPREIRERLTEQKRYRGDADGRLASDAYIDFLALGGRLRFNDLTPRLIRRILAREIPILTGLSATYLHRTAREIEATEEADDLRGQPVGHFVVLCGYDRLRKRVLVADPLHPNPLSETSIYEAETHRVINAILLGVITYDANLLVIEPAGEREV